MATKLVFKNYYIWYITNTLVHKTTEITNFLFTKLAKMLALIWDPGFHAKGKVKLKV